MSRLDYDIVLDGNNFRLMRGEDKPYVRRFSHLSVQEHELFNPRSRGTMTSTNVYRVFRQTDWSGGHTWYKPTLPNSGGTTYSRASLFDAWSKPGNLVPLNLYAENADTEMPYAGNVVRGEDGNIQLVTDDFVVDGSTYKEMEQWSPAADAFATFGTPLASGITTTLHRAAKTVYDPSDQITVVLGLGSTNTTANVHELGKVDVEAGTYSTILSTDNHSVGSNIFLFDGKVMVFDGETIRALNSGKTAYDATAITDDNLGKDVMMGVTAAGSQFGAFSDGNNVFHAGSVNLAVTSDRGIFYVKHVFGPNGIEARIFQVEVTDATSTYLRTPVGRLPAGMVCLNITWHMDSLLMIVTPDPYLVKKNLIATGRAETQLWHVTQGTMGAIGVFEAAHGAGTPSEAPYTFPYAQGPLQYISSHDKLWLYDTVRGGLHQVHQFATDVVGGLWGGFDDENSAGEPTYVFVGYNTYHQQTGQTRNDPQTGTWAADRYTVESNYIDFGVPLENKTLRSVTALFEAGSANETYYIDIEVDDSGSWTTVATMTCDNGGTIIETDLTGVAGLTGNRFRYRIRLEIDSGTNMPEFRGLELKAVSGEKVEMWQLTLDGTEITNMQNVPQRPDTVYNNLVTTGRKDGMVKFTDKFGKVGADAETSIDVMIDDIVMDKTDEGETRFQVTLHKVDV